MATPSLKRLQIDKANSTMLVVVAVAVFITIFCLLSSKTLLAQLSYQDRVITAKQSALNQLQSDVTTSSQLVRSYANFVNRPQNIIGGSTTGTSGQDGDNGKIILDALPSEYDFPALITSVQQLLTSQGVNLDGISGTDEQATQSGDAASSTTPAATPTIATALPGGVVAMPFEFSVEGPYTNIVNLITTLQKSIRPFDIQSMQLSGNETDMTLSVTAQSFYQPGTNFTITTKEVK